MQMSLRTNVNNLPMWKN